MHLRAYYTWAILAPLAILAVVAALGGDVSSSTAGFGPGATIRWLYPPSPIRDLTAGTAVCCWLLWKLYCRPLGEFREAIRRAPAVMLVLLMLPPLTTVLVHGLARRILSEQGALIPLRWLVRLIMGFGYVALVEWVRQRLQTQDVLQTEAAG